MDMQSIIKANRECEFESERAGLPDCTQCPARGEELTACGITTEHVALMEGALEAYRTDGDLDRIDELDAYRKEHGLSH